ncbi:DUF962 domain-containing protein [Chromobacterium sp. IIBBL 290-4]|uniref:Mpo1 family 2-hydroxy fatty acid dioxygenase n=1 Tax=Chromobacterium sp. IIBBL 290-4 TaxID=2953890 RepID=UPI0020B87D4B|nr:Mpo1-like protein [Chromobacterium sp. IIBBL 290-4]UTH75996.1 DUF962 domain-containing protein [Chromobacterium sp. IIBBL 290-4]
MKTLNQWLTDYDESHRHPFNIAMHKLCVPLIALSLLGMLQAIPGPLSWAWLLWLLAGLWYARLSLKVAAAMALMSGVALLALETLRGMGAPVGVGSLLVFIAAWLGQFIGHAREGKKPSFIQDLQFLLVGPLWTLRGLWRRLGWLDPV